MDGLPSKAVATAAQPFDVVLLDYQLPDVVNWGLLTLLRQMTPTERDRLDDGGSHSGARR